MAAKAKESEQVQPAKLDETVLGGRYLVNGVYVDAHNQPLADQGEQEAK